MCTRVALDVWSTGEPFVQIWCTAYKCKTGGVEFCVTSSAFCTWGTSALYTEVHFGPPAILGKGKWPTLELDVVGGIQPWFTFCGTFVLLVLLVHFCTLGAAKNNFWTHLIFIATRCLQYQSQLLGMMQITNERGLLVGRSCRSALVQQRLILDIF